MKNKNEQIEFLISFVKKYPSIMVESSNNLSPSFFYKSEKNSDEKAFIEEYQEASKCYVYLRTRKSQGKLTKEELEQLKNANIGGVFGCSNEVEKLEKDYNINPGDGIEIIRKYGTIENFFNQYKNDNLDERESLLASKLLKPVYDIDINEKSKNYDILARAILNLNRMGTEKGLYYYSSKKLEEAINNLYSREALALKTRFGLEDGKIKGLEETAKILNVTRERFRQMEAKAFRKLRYPVRLEEYSGNLTDIIDSYIDLDDNTREMIYKADDTLRLSRTMDEKTNEARELINNLVKNAIKEKQEANKDKKIEDKTLDEIIISVRTYNCLKRANLRTIGAIASVDYDQLCKVRNMGRKSLLEVIQIMKDYGYEMVDGKFISKEENDKKMIETKENKKEILVDIKEKKIEDLNMSTRLFNCLNRTRQIKTFGDILSHNTMYYVKVRNLGSGCLRELLNLVHSYGYILVDEDIINETNSEKSLDAGIVTADIKDNALIQNITNQNEEQRKRLEEKKEKSKLLDEYIKLMLEQQKLNEIESKLDNEIKQKEEQLKKLGLKNEN